MSRMNGTPNNIDFKTMFFRWDGEGKGGHATQHFTGHLQF